MSAAGETVAIIGGGIVGLAVARAVQTHRPGARVVVLEKEARLAAHQTGHNSGVLHSGIYYAPGSLKARTCRAGRKAMEAFCEREGLPWRRCGKVIVAVDEDELPRLHALHRRGLENGVDCEIVGPERLLELEPQAAGRLAIHVREAGVVDFVAVTARLAEQVRAGGGQVRTGRAVTALAEHGEKVRVQAGEEVLEADRVVNCAGLHSDRIARLAGLSPSVRIVPFRGEYHLLRAEARDRVRALIYPVPDPRFPFLGVHLTRTLHGEVKAGPNAVLAGAREGYRRRDLRGRDLWELATWPGLPRLACRHAAMGVGELHRSLSPRAFHRAAARLLPTLARADLTPGPTGVRAQALDRRGRLVDDFVLERAGRVLHVLNAPSPAATAAFAIAETVVARLLAE